MAIGFRPYTLSVENFRGLRVLDLEFPERSPLAIVGANNACKSTILEAVSMALGGPGFYNYNCGRYDFFHGGDGGVASRFNVTVMFKPRDEEELPAVRGGIGTPLYVHGARVRGSTDKTGRYSHSVRLVDEEGKDISLPSGLALKGDAAVKWKEHDVSFHRPYARWNDISDYRPDLWHLKPSNLFVSLYQWKTGPLHRLASMLAKRFFETSWSFEYDGKQRPMPDTLKSFHKFLVASLNGFPFWKDDLKPKLQKTLTDYVGRQAQIELRPDIKAIEDWLVEQLILSFSADEGGVVTPLEKMGDGWQSLVRIAALDVLSQYPEVVDSHVVLLFEEPESFLHPHLARKLRGVLERLADSGWTVVITTHSPSLVSFSKSQHIVRLTRNGDSVAGMTLRAAEVDGATKFQERLDERGAHEFLFAQKVVLCEGQDDVFAVRSYLEARLAEDLDGKSLSIIRTGDVGQLPAFAAMATKLGIPWFALADEDLDDQGNVQEATQKVADKLKTLMTATDQIGVWPKNLEVCLQAPGKAKPEWQVRYIEPKSLDDLRVQLPGYVRVCEDIRGWLKA